MLLFKGARHPWAVHNDVAPAPCHASSRDRTVPAHIGGLRVFRTEG